VFVLIGLQLPYVMAELAPGTVGGMSRMRLIEYGVGFSLVMIVVRMIWVYGETYLAYAARRWWLKVEATRPDPRRVFVVGWAGMRGVLSLAAAITLPFTLPSGQVFAQRSMIVFLVFCLILSTLVMQGLTLPWLIRRLGLADPGRINFEEQEARRVLLLEAMVYLDRARTKDRGKATAIFDDVLAEYRRRLDAVPAQRHESAAGVADFARRNEVMREVVQVERAALIRLRDEERIDDEVARVLQRELDLAESRTHTGVTALD
jgi:NhaP-type Na+/H+ or K+/H+ antiporter